MTRRLTMGLRVFCCSGSLLQNRKTLKNKGLNDIILSGKSRIFENVRIHLDIF